MITDARNRILSVNRAFTAITGYAREEVLGRDPRLLSAGRYGAEFFQEALPCTISRPTRTTTRS